MDEEEALAAGNWTDEVVRVGGAVHRSRGPNSDFAKPGLRLDDLAYMAWTWCIYADSRIPVEDQARRLNNLRLGYGFGSGQQLLEAILRRQSEMISLCRG